jgi:hypothetical protein
MLRFRGLWAERDPYCGASVFPVPSEGTPHSVASYNTHRNVIEDETEALCQIRCGMVKIILIPLPAQKSRLPNIGLQAAKFRPMFGARGLWAGRDLYRATPVVTRGLGFSGLIWRTAPFSLLRHTRGCGQSILTRIPMGPHSVTYYEKRGCGGLMLTRMIWCLLVTYLIFVLTFFK